MNASNMVEHGQTSEEKEKKKEKTNLSIYNQAFLFFSFLRDEMGWCLKFGEEEIRGDKIR